MHACRYLSWTIDRTCTASDYRNTVFATLGPNHKNILWAHHSGLCSLFLPTRVFVRYSRLLGFPLQSCTRSSCQSTYPTHTFTRLTHLTHTFDFGIGFKRALFDIFEDDDRFFRTHQEHHRQASYTYLESRRKRSLAHELATGALPRRVWRERDEEGVGKGGYHAHQTDANHIRDHLSIRGT